MSEVICHEKGGWGCVHLSQKEREGLLLLFIKENRGATEKNK